MRDVLLKMACVDSDFLLSHCDKKEVQLRWHLGMMISVLGLISFLSINMAICQCLHSQWQFCLPSLILSGILTFSFINAYRFVLTTICMDPKYSLEINLENKKYRRMASFFRLIFIGLLGIILGQGLFIYAFQGPIEQIIQQINNPAVSDEAILRIMNGLGIHPSNIEMLSTGGLISRLYIAKGLLGNKVILVEGMIVLLYNIPVAICLYSERYRYGSYTELVWAHNRLSILNDHRHLEEIYSEVFELTTGEKVELYTGYLDSPFELTPIPIKPERYL